MTEEKPTTKGIRRLDEFETIAKSVKPVKKNIKHEDDKE